ncbi:MULTISPECIES: outer membrane protein assembly factor BamE domain-containing protein [unclassified Saccharicrinis]|uniref:outer membrane protein assembly factor BamE domain-containing protein n=1 Tax=unclassified Saccharicrinis TaxID=2646859 RepID=UPI003D348F21
MKDILIGKGFDEIRFGMTRQQVKEILGEPDEIDAYSSSEEADDNTEAYHYDELELSVSFDEMDDWRLGSIAVSSPDAVLEGLKLVGITDDDLLAKLSAIDLGDYDREDVSSPESPDHEVVTFYEASINFWIENGAVTEIQFGPLWDDDNEAYIWPED